MIIKSIQITEGLYSRSIDFADKVNLIHSEHNTKGKTTLLRFLLYSLGYNVPSTKNIKFEKCGVETIIDSEKVGEVKLLRTSKNHISVTTSNGLKIYVLPEEQNKLHSIIFGTENIDILENLLGAFYTDQEKGWTLLNRGTVIGSIGFNIERLVRGLSGRDCNDLIQKEAKLARELSKYKQIFSVAKYQETIEAESGSLAVEHYDEKINSELEQLQIRKNFLQKESRRLSQTINDNERFRNFIADMKLLVKGTDGVVIPVTTDNILGFDDNIEYLITKQKLISSELSLVRTQISNLENQKEYEEEQLFFWESETITQAFDRKISSLEINPVVIQKEIHRLTKELKNVRKRITDETKNGNEIVESLYSNIFKYATELKIDEKMPTDSSYLFTSNLRELTGALLHKTVFAFRMAYIIEIERILDIKLPIILDSPSGKEVDQENIKRMISILKRDFSDHQIIIASIFRYDFPVLNTIEIVNRLIEIK